MSNPYYEYPYVDPYTVPNYPTNPYEDPNSYIVPTQYGYSQQPTMQQTPMIQQPPPYGQFSGASVGVQPGVPAPQVLQQVPQAANAPLLPKQPPKDAIGKPDKIPIATPYCLKNCATFFTGVCCGLVITTFFASTIASIYIYRWIPDHKTSMKIEYLAEKGTLGAVCKFIAGMNLSLTKGYNVFLHHETCQPEELPNDKTAKML